MVNFNTQIPSLLFQFLCRFKDCFSKPVFLSFCFYLSGLFLELKRTSIQSISARTLYGKYENLQYFMSEAKWDSEKLNNYRLFILQSNRTTKTCRKGVLVIDDSGCKKWGYKTEGVAEQHYGTEDIITKCNVVVVSAYCDDKKHYPVNLKPYRPEQEFFFQKNDPDFKSKIQLAKELIQDALDKNILFFIIVFDTWYFSNEIVNFVQEKHLTFISEAKSDRLISFRGKWTHADELVKLIPADKFRPVTVSDSQGKNKTFWTYGFYSKLRNINGRFLIVVSVGSWNESDPEKVHVFVTNHNSLSPEQVIRKYALRWGIECIFRDLKDNLAFDHYQIRSLKAISRHWHLVSLAYTFLLLSKSNGSFSKIFHQKPTSCAQQLELFRKLNSHTQLNWITNNPQLYQSYLGIKKPLPRNV